MADSEFTTITHQRISDYFMDEAVAASWHTCEKCGSTIGVTTNREGYWLTLCPHCRKELKPRVITKRIIDYEQKFAEKQVHETLL